MSRVPEGYRTEEDVGAVCIKNASRAAHRYVRAASKHDEDGRSQWLWVRLPNGDVILGVFPQGATYEMFEKEYP
jgi:hypothetical protein